MINRGSPLKVDDVEIIPGVAHALALLTHSGFALAIATNQPSASKGLASREELEKVHARVLELSQSEGGKIERSYICWHSSVEGCTCRKPKPGLLLNALHDFPCFSEPAWMVGDRETDIQAAKTARVKSAFLTPYLPQKDFADFTGLDLLSFTQWKLSQKSSFRDLSKTFQTSQTL